MNAESSKGPDVYAMAMAAEGNSSFVAAENGSEFLFQEPSGLDCTIVGAQQCGVTLFFYQYGEYGQNATAYCIFFGLPPGSYSATVFVVADSGIAISTSASVNFTM